MFSIEFCKLLFEVLCHSLWQALSVSVVVWLLLRFLPARRSETRYAIACAGQCTLLVGMLCTWSILNLPAEEGRMVAHEGPAVVQEIRDFEIRAGFADVDTVPTVGNATQATAVMSDGPYWITWTILAWSVGVLVMLIRTIRGYRGIRFWKREQVDAVDESVEFGLNRIRDFCAELSRAIGLRRNVAIAVSDRIGGPLVVGTWWPVILLPLNMLSGNTLSDEQWRVVVAHELAHVRRYDGLVNLAQILIESFLFFNPFVWWLSRYIRAEREACCDAMALKLTGKPITVASTLLDIAERSSAAAVRHPQPAFAFAAHGNGEERRPGSLRDRITRLVKPDQAPGIPLTWLSFVLSLLLLAGTGFALKKGTDVAVQSVASMLTPKERVDELARVQTLNTGIVVPPASSDGDAPAPPSRDVPVRVVVTVEDGLPVPKQVNLTFHEKSPGLSKVTSDFCKASEDDSVFVKDKVLRPGVLVVSASVGTKSGEETYRPDASGLVRLVAGSTDPIEIKLTLRSGVDSHVQIFDDNEKPLAGVPVSILAWASMARGKLAINDVGVRGTTDADGRIAVPHVSEKLSYTLRVRSEGWELEHDRKIELRDQQVTKFALTPALPTAIRVVDSVHGEPITGVSVIEGGVQEIAEDDPGFNEDPRSSRGALSTTLLGKTDEEGRLTLRVLNRSQKYRLGYFKDGYQFATNVVIASKSPEEVVLKPALTASGQVDGDIKLLQTRRFDDAKRPVLACYNRFRVGDSWRSDVIYVPVNEDGSFTVNNLIPGRLEIRAAGIQKKFTVNESRDDLLVSIYSKEDLPIKQTNVTLNFTGLPNGHPIRGTVQGYCHTRSSSKQIKKTEIRDGQISLQAPAGSRVDLRPDGIVGAFVSDDKLEFQLAESEEKQVFDVPVSAAGGIYGQLTRHDGSLADGASISVHCTDESGPHPHKLNSSVGNHSPTFFRSLPLGNRYVVLARELHDGTAVWAVSDEFEVSESQPIHRIALQFDKPEQRKIRVVDENGQPLMNTKVQLSVGHSMNHHSTGAGVERRTDGDGFATFNLMLSGQSGPFEFRNRITVHPMAGLIGWEGPLEDVSADGVIVLANAVSAGGRIVNANTGKPVSDVAVRVLPKWDSDAVYKQNQRTRTDTNGVFRFTSLEPVSYTVYIDGTIPDGAVVIEKPGGGYRYEYPNGAPQVSREIFGGDEQDVEFRVRMHGD